MRVPMKFTQTTCALMPFWGMSINVVNASTLMQQEDFSSKLSDISFLKIGLVTDQSDAIIFNESSEFISTSAMNYNHNLDLKGTS